MESWTQTDQYGHRRAGDIHSGTNSPHDLGRDGFFPSNYTMPYFVNTWTSSPRFTYSHCTDDYLHDATRTSYIGSIASGTVFVLCLCFAWMILLLTFKFLGPDKVGWASGKVRRPPRPSDPGGAAAAAASGEDSVEIVEEEVEAEEEDDETSVPDEEAAEEERRAEEEDEVFLKNDNGDDAGAGSSVEFFQREKEQEMQREQAEDVGYRESKVSNGIVVKKDGLTDEDGKATPSGEGSFDDENKKRSTTLLAKEMEKDNNEEEVTRGKNGCGAILRTVMRRPRSAAEVGARKSQQAPEDYVTALAAWEMDTVKFEKRLRSSRIAFICCGVGIIIASIIFFVVGAHGRNNSVGKVNESLTLVQDVLLDKHVGTDDLIDALIADKNARHIFRESTAECPGLIDHLGDAHNLTEAETDALRILYWQVSPILDVVNTLTVRGAAGTSSALREGVVLLEEAKGETRKLDNYFYITVTIMALLDFLVLVLVGCVVVRLGYCANNNLAKLVLERSWFCVPAFVMFAFLSWVVTSTFILGTVASADFCAAPNVYAVEIMSHIRCGIVRQVKDNLEIWRDAVLEFLQNILEVVDDVVTNATAEAGVNLTNFSIEEIADLQSVCINTTMDSTAINCTELLDEFSDVEEFLNDDIDWDYVVENVTNVTKLVGKTVVLEFGAYYAGQCSLDLLPPYVDIMSQVGNLSRVVGGYLHTFLTIVADSDHTVSSQISGFCGEAVAADIANASSIYHDALHGLQDAVDKLLPFFACSSFNPVFNIVLHEAICYYSVDWLLWLFAIGICIAVLSMVMVSLRYAVNDLSAERMGDCAVIGAEDEGKQRRKKVRRRRDKLCVLFLWVSALVVMVAILASMISYINSGYKEHTNRAECPAQLRQFSNETMYREEKYTVKGRWKMCFEPPYAEPYE